MSKITPELLKAIAPGTNAELRDRFLSALNLALPLYGIDTKLEVDGFLTTSCFESDHFKTMREYGHGAGRAYGKPDKITGLVYYGRGIFQNTWKKGYQAFTNYVKAHWAFIQPRSRLAEPPNFVMEPELLATVFWAVEAACWYWEENHLAKYARQGLDGFFALQGLVNRGSASKRALDYDDREAIYKKALAATPDDFKLDLATQQSTQTDEQRDASTISPEPAKPVAETNSRPTLKFGSRDTDVGYLQSLLGLPITGHFDTPEENAVETFQEQRGLKIDGIVGPDTWAALETVNVDKSTCFTLDTPIWTPDGEIPIGEIVVGQKVISFDPIGGVVDYDDEVTEVLDHEAGGFYTFEFEHGAINVTPEHRLFRGNNVFVLADMFRIGEIVKAFQDEWADSKLVRIRWSGEKTKVRNLHVRSNHTYFANRCGVHNAKVNSSVKENLTEGDSDGGSINRIGPAEHCPNCGPVNNGHVCDTPGGLRYVDANAQRLNDLQHDVDGLGVEGSAGKPEPPPDVTVKAATMTWEQRIAAVGAFLASIGISIRDGFSNPYVLIAIGVFALIAYLIFRHAQKDKQERTLKYIDNALDPKTGNLTVV